MWDCVGPGKAFRFHWKGNVQPMKNLKQQRGRTWFPLLARWGMDYEAARVDVRRPVRAIVVLVGDDSGLDLGKWRMTDALEIHLGSFLSWRKKRKASITSTFLAQANGWTVMIFTEVEETGGGTQCAKQSIWSTQHPQFLFQWRDPLPNERLPILLSIISFSPIGSPLRTISCNYNTNNIWFQMADGMKRLWSWRQKDRLIPWF